MNWRLDLHLMELNISKWERQHRMSYVVILQFPSGNFSIADGDIEAINGNDVQYQIGTEGGSSGSPLLNLNCVALAMHNAGPGAASSQPVGIRQATALSAVVKAYLEERPHVETGEAPAINRAPHLHNSQSGEFDCCSSIARDRQPFQIIELWNDTQQINACFNA